jgi:uncharacterized protein (TIGR01777 family)
MPSVLISGGSGLIGQHLCRKLQEKGYDVAILSRSSKPNTLTASYYWDIDRNEIDREAINNCDFIIHLAGVNIGEKRWTTRRKQAILNSRIKSADLVFNSIDKQNNKLKAFISASAVGYYGAVTSERIYTETDSSSNDFLGETCSLWEQAADRFTGIGIRTVKIRTGVVLSKKGGALAKLKMPIQLGFGSAIGHGRQYMPWIHMDDLCAIYIQALEDEEMNGAFNAVAPEHITNKALTRKMARALHKPFWFPNLPAFIMKLLFGEMAVMLLSGSRVSSEKIKASGFTFQFPNLESALIELFS